MRTPRFRFTIRRMMAAVAIVGISLWTFQMTRRIRVYRSLAGYHASRSWTSPIAGPPGPIPRGVAPNGEVTSAGRNHWHTALAAKYLRAARYPWLPVERDPPEPE